MAIDLPQDKNDRVKLVEALNEGKKSLLKIEAEKQHLKDIEAHLLDEFDISKANSKKWMKSLVDDAIHDKAHEAYTVIESIREANETLGI